MGQRINVKKILGIIAAFTGSVILITRLPYWIWMLAVGVFLIWFGLLMYQQNW
ncbi:hypothetical protein [Caldanaerovirga acetigignens]|uniref:hypothetical protein n=1 Tax=Caldanaerovirga acetigignens TaxID=447595 RepID=UPI00165F47BD|nr:hypothetical protein [Caldanaerovirga acetigignens]